MNESDTQIEVQEKEQDLIQAGKRAKNKKAVSATLAAQINEEFANAQKLAGDVTTLALLLENSRIKIGTLLKTAKEEVGHGKFLKWRADNCPLILKTTAERCMACAKHAKYQQIESLEGLKEYHKILVSYGLKEAPEGHGPQQLHDFNAFAIFTKAIMSTRQKITEVFERQPLEGWDDESREQLKAQLEPLIEIYESL
jgi:hypothetical protein